MTAMADLESGTHVGGSIDRTKGDWEMAWAYARAQAFYDSDAYDEHCFGARGSVSSPTPTSGSVAPDARGAILKRTPGQYSAWCPAHDDAQASLRIKIQPDGKVLLHCWAGCETRAVLHAMTLRWSDLRPRKA
jgi:hypothetical protein